MFKKLLAGSAIFLGAFTAAHANSIYLAPAAFYQSLQADSVHYQGVSPRLALDYGGMQSEWLYFALEGYFSDTTIVVNNVPRDGISLKTKWTYGASALPGVLLDEGLIGYVRAGWSGIKEREGQHSGWQVGGGFQIRMTPCWDMRLEYAYSRYDAIKGVGNKFSAEEYLVGGVYKLFDGPY